MADEIDNNDDLLDIMNSLDDNLEDVKNTEDISEDNESNDNINKNAQVINANNNNNLDDLDFDLDDENDEDNFNSLIEEFRKLQSDIISHMDKDDDVIQSTFQLLMDRIRDEDKVKQYYIEAITSLLSTKVHSSASRIRLLDSVTKFTNSIKNSKPSGGIDLSDLLKDD